MSESNTLKLPRKSFWISIVFLTTWYLALIWLTRYLRAKGFVFVEGFYIGLIVTMTVTVLLFLINPARLWSKVGVWFLRIVMILVTMISIGMMFVAINPTSLDIQNAARKRVSDLERLHRLSQIGPYIPNQVTKKIGTVSPVLNITYEVSIQPKNDKPVLLQRYSTTSTLDMSEELLSKSKMSVVDLGSHAVGVENGQLWVLNKTTLTLRRYPGLFNVLSEIEDKELLSFLGFELMGDQYILISPTLSQDDKVGDPTQYAVLDRNTDIVKLFDLPQKCKTQTSPCMVRYVSDSVVDISFFPSANRCGEMNHFTYFLQKDTFTMRVINEFHACSGTYNKYLGVYDNQFVIFSATESGNALYSKDPITNVRTILTENDSIPNEVYEVMPIGAGSHLVGVIGKDFNDTFDLNTRKFIGEKPKKTQDISDYLQLPYHSAIVQKEDAELMGKIATVKIIKQALNPKDLQKNEKLGSYSINTQEGDLVNLAVPELKAVFETIAPPSVEYRSIPATFQINNVYLLQAKRILFETETKRTGVMKDIEEALWAESEYENSKRVGMLNVETGDVFLVDQNRTSEIAHFDETNQMVLIKSKNREGGYLYRVLDLRNNIPLASFALGDWTYVDPTRQYGPNLMLPIHRELGLKFQMSHCMNSRNIRTDCLVTPYKLVVMGESLECQNDTCSFLVRVEKGTSVDKNPSEPSAIGKIVRISIDSKGMYQIDENVAALK